MIRVLKSIPLMWLRYVRKAERARYDVILLDVDNGPVAMVSETNVSLYSNSGLRWLRGSLKA